MNMGQNLDLFNSENAEVPIATITIWVIIIKTFVKSNDEYMGHNNQDFDLFQRQFLIGLYECSSRKQVRARPTRY